MRMKEKVEKEVALLGDLSRENLVELWTKVHGRPPPKGIKQGLLLRSAAWHLQRRRLGGLSAEGPRKLKRAMRRIDADCRCTNTPDEERIEGSTKASQAAAVTDASASLRPGARLVRDWNGRTHVVEVTSDGFLFAGKNFRSLSAIARHITGARWSRPRFFGL